MTRPTTLRPVDPAPSTESRRAPVWVLTIFVLCGLAYVGLFFDAIYSRNADLLQGLTVVPVLVALTVPIAFRLARTDRDRTIASIVLAGLAVKLLMAFARFRVARDVYGGRSDANFYDIYGASLAPQFRRLDFSADIGSLTSTGSIRFLTGIVYAIFGSGQIVGYFVFAWLGFLGFLLFARAFKLGVPRGDSRRYLIAVLFLPSLLYWPSSIGKEAPMVLAAGLCAYGVACLFARRTDGLFFLGGGLLAMLVVRPHLALIVFVGLAFAAIVRKSPTRGYASALFKFLGVVALIALGVYLASRTQSFLDQKLKLQDASLTTQLTETQTRTTEAGSAFSPVTVNTPLDLPLAAVTVLFRPFPFEASNTQTLLTSAETMFTLALCIGSWKRVRSAPRMLRNTSYVAYAIGYLFAFIVAFSAFANFGILARQRVQAVPLLLVLIALPKFQNLTAPAPAGAGAGADAEPAAVPDGARDTASPTARYAGTRRQRRPPSRRVRVPVSSGISFAPPPRHQL